MSWWTYDGGLTLLPPLVAIGMALLTRRVLASLSLALLAGAWVVGEGSAVAASRALVDTLYRVIVDFDKLTITGFSLSVAAMVGVLSAAGATHSLVAWATTWARGRRGAMLATWVAGGTVFFDDYANCLVVGNTMGPLCDRHGVSRAKLAYLVDATAAPIASLAVVSTWVGYEIGLLGDALVGTGISATGLQLFLLALPFRFYCWTTLGFVGLVAATGRDFGPMAEAEAEAAAHPVVSSEVPTTPVWVAILPILTLVFATFGLIYNSGRTALAADTEGPMNPALFEVLGAADAFTSMFIAALLSLGLAFLLVWGTRTATPGQTSRAAADGMGTILTAMVVLYLAWTLGDLIQSTNAGNFLTSLLPSDLAPGYLPALVFVLASVTAFSTGSSFFTMAILIPIAVPLATTASGGEVGPVLLAASAAVLDGAVLGDHASPISDTTILSSAGSKVDVVTHVRTQLPYVLVAGALAVILGTLPASFGVTPWLLVPAAWAASGVVLIAIGRNTRT
ncbi:MAG: Na+/H+ antiporter NhaC family protein [Myxococcota bacterium]